jgi:hypothetical protein
MKIYFKSSVLLKEEKYKQMLLPEKFKLQSLFLISSKSLIFKQIEVIEKLEINNNMVN